MREYAEIAMAVRPEIRKLVALEHFPSESASDEEFAAFEAALSDVTKPVSDDEAAALASLFPTDDYDCFEAVWTLIHLVETAPNWRTSETLRELRGYWGENLRKRVRNAEKWGR